MIFPVLIIRVYFFINVFVMILFFIPCYSTDARDHARSQWIQRSRVLHAQCRSSARLDSHDGTGLFWGRDIKTCIASKRDPVKVLWLLLYICMGHYHDCCILLNTCLQWYTKHDKVDQVGQSTSTVRQTVYKYT